MPTEQITVCTSCGKRACDGSIWKWVEATDLHTREPVDLASLPKLYKESCTFKYGVRFLDQLRNLPVGSRVALDYANWKRPCRLTIEKIESGHKKGANHGEFPIMHAEMVRQFQVWIDEFTQREHGFRLSTLQGMEAAIARLSAITDRNAEQQDHLDKVILTYRKHWLARRQALDSL